MSEKPAHGRGTDMTRRAALIAAFTVPAAAAVDRVLPGGEAYAQAPGKKREAGPRTPEQVRYDAAQAYRGQNRTAHSTNIVFHQLTTGEYIDVGLLNTRSDFQIIEEDDALPVIESLGFKTFTQFAEEFNKTFPPVGTFRSKAAELITHAQKVDAEFGTVNIPRTDTAFQQIRLALCLFIIDKRFQENPPATIRYNTLSFNTGELRAFGIDPRIIPLRDPGEVAQLHYILEFIRTQFPRITKEIQQQGIQQPLTTLATDFNAVEQVNKKLTPAQITAFKQLTQAIARYDSTMPGPKTVYDDKAYLMLSDVQKKFPQLWQLTRSYGEAKKNVCETYDVPSLERLQDAFDCQSHSTGP